MEQFKRAQIIMLPTNNIFQSGLQPYSVYSKPITKGGWMLPKSGAEARRLHQNGNQAYHLYIISDDEIKEEDWCLCGNKTLLQIKKQLTYDNIKTANNDFECKKIIGTTDTSLTLSDQYHIYDILPQPSQQFIEKYIECYNKNEVITEVLVECFYSSGGFSHIQNIKVNPKDNTITIKKLKDSWNREEVIELLKNYRNSIIEVKPINIIYLDKWIKENL